MTEDDKLREIDFLIKDFVRKFSCAGLVIQSTIKHDVKNTVF